MTLHLSASHSTTDPENPVPVRPTAFREIHGWAGWGAKL